MARNYNVAGWLLLGTMTISTIFQPQASLAYAIDAAESHARVEVQPTEAIDLYQQGLTAAAAGNLNLAIANFDRAIDIDARYFQAYIERGNVKDAMGDLSGAIADYTSAISIAPQVATAYYNRGTVSAKSNRHPDAIRDFQRAIALDPGYAPAYMNLGNELDDLGDSAGALRNYDRAISIDPKYALAYLNRGIAHERAGNRTQAIADLRLAANLFKAVGNIDRYNRALKMIGNLRSQV
jgi:tetratricopeptide (TPR) repeat protein